MGMLPRPQTTPLHSTRGAAPGEVALVTGSARRIGAALIRELASRGLTVAIHFKNSEREATALAEEVESAGGTARTFQANLDLVSEAEKLFEEVVDSLGPPAVLVHNASRFEECDLSKANSEKLRRELALHVESPLALSRAFADALAPDASGRIVALLDWRASQPDPTVLPYSISKGALWGMVRNLALELAPQVTVNAVSPGVILPASSREHESLDRLTVGLPIQRPGLVDEVIEACCFFIFGAGFTTGTILPVDGGRHLL